MVCECIKTVDAHRGEIEAAVREASEFLRRRGLSADCHSTEQTVRNVLYALACENWEVNRKVHRVRGRNVP